MMFPEDKMIDNDWPMHVRVWWPEVGEKRPYLLIHGLSSDAQTWNGVAQPTLFPYIKEPVLICVAENGSEWAEQKREQVRVAANLISQAEAVWFPDTAHDVHVEKPVDLVQVFEEFAS